MSSRVVGILLAALFGIGCDAADDSASDHGDGSRSHATKDGGQDVTGGTRSAQSGSGSPSHDASTAAGAGASGAGPSSGTGGASEADAATATDSGNPGVVDGPPVVDGWTELAMQPGALVIYVSTDGDDANPGTIDEPKATFEAAYEAVRDGEPDWVLFKRGDVWTREQGIAWFKSGPAADDAGFMRIGAYGDENLARPRLDSGMSGGLILSPGYQATRALTHLAVTDIEFVAAARLAAGAAAGPDVTGIQLLAVEYMGSGDPLRSILFENVKLQGFSFGITSGGDIADFKVRRCILTEIFMPGGAGTHSSGILTDGRDILLEENVFYRIQHPDNPAVTEISTFAHSAYIGAEARNVVARGNIIIKATEGFMQRPGGVFERNLSVLTEIAHLSGQAWGVTPTAGGVTATIRDNLFLSSASSLILGNTASGVVQRNLIVRGPEGTASIGIDLISENAQGDGNNIGVHDTSFEDNVVSGSINYTMTDTQSFSGLTFTNNRTEAGAIETSIAEFVTSVGLSGDIDDYAADLVTRDRESFQTRHLSTAMLDFYRSAEGLPALP